MNAGDIVRLNKEANNSIGCPDSRDNNVTSVIDYIDVEDGATKLMTDLCGCRWWNLTDLEPANQLRV